MKPKQNLIVINTWIIFRMCFVYNYKRDRNVCQSSKIDLLSLRQFFDKSGIKKGNFQTTVTTEDSKKSCFLFFAN